MHIFTSSLPRAIGLCLKCIASNLMPVGLDVWNTQRDSVPPCPVTHNNLTCIMVIYHLENGRHSFKSINFFSDNYIGIMRGCYTPGSLPGVNEENGCHNWTDGQGSSFLVCFCDTDYCNSSSFISHAGGWFFSTLLAILKIIWWMWSEHHIFQSSNFDNDSLCKSSYKPWYCSMAYECV